MVGKNIVGGNFRISENLIAPTFIFLHHLHAGNTGTFIHDNVGSSVAYIKIVCWIF
jgi:hypothetical protein